MGSTGESVMLTPDEKFTMWELVAKHAAPEKLLIAGTGMESVRETVCLTNRAAEMGYKAAMVRTPHYYKNLVNRADAQTLYFRAVADQSKIPLIIYNWPQATGVDIPVEAVVAISEHPNIIAIKESSGSLEKVMQMIREVKHGFQVMVGSAPTLWPSLLMGACGAILAYANAAPYSVIAIWEAYRTREEAAGLDWQNRIGRASALVTTKYGVPGLKYAMDLNGYYGGPPRLPLCVPTPEAKEEIEEAFQRSEGRNAANARSERYGTPRTPRAHGTSGRAEVDHAVRRRGSRRRRAPGRSRPSMSFTAHPRRPRLAAEPHSRTIRLTGSRSTPIRRFSVRRSSVNSTQPATPAEAVSPARPSADRCRASAAAGSRTGIPARSSARRARREPQRRPRVAQRIVGGRVEPAQRGGQQSDGRARQDSPDVDRVLAA